MLPHWLLAMFLTPNVFYNVLHKTPLFERTENAEGPPSRQRSHRGRCTLWRLSIKPQCSSRALVFYSFTMDLPWICHEYMTFCDFKGPACGLVQSTVSPQSYRYGAVHRIGVAWSKAICARSFCAEATNAGFHHLSEELFYANIQRLKHETRYIMYIIYFYIHTYLYMYIYIYCWLLLLLLLFL